MIDIDEAQSVVLTHARPGPTISLPLGEASGRTLARPIACDVDYPPFDRAVMDGYAVRAADVENAPVTLKMVGRIAAGRVPDKGLSPGEAMQINTGAPIPDGADAVVRVEDTETRAGGGAVLIRVPALPGSFITLRATYISAGAKVLETGTLLTPLAIGAAATAGAGVVTVYRQPEVALLATGDELIDIDQTPTGAQIRNSSRYVLEALVRSAHAKPVPLGVVSDEREALRARIVDGLGYDVLCLTGGVSMGAFDFVPEVLADCGATLHLRSLSIKPGKPTVFATTADGTLVFGLPGNPVSTFVAFELLVRPALSAMQGRPEGGRPGGVPRPVRAGLRGSVPATTDRRSFWPARVVVNVDGELEAEALPWQGSGDAFGMATANGLIVRPPRQEVASTGDTVTIILLDRI